MLHDHKSAGQRVRTWMGRIVVKLWPKESRDWGQAFAAELPEIVSRWHTICWLVGGLVLLARERFKHFPRSFARPFGVPAGNPLAPAAWISFRVPRMPRWVTALLLMASAGILLHPEVRMSVPAVAASLAGNGQNISRWQSVRLALLSLVAKDDSEKRHWADAAIARDPAFTWLLYENLRFERDSDGRFASLVRGAASPSS
jgi:hypothetical protein